MTDFNKATQSLTTVLALLEANVSKPFELENYNNILLALRETGSVLKLDLATTHEKYLTGNDYGSVAAAIKAAALSGEIDGEEFESSYELVMDMVSDLITLTGEAAAMTEEGGVLPDAYMKLNKDVMSADYFAILEAIGQLADTDQINICTAFESF